MNDTISSSGARPVTPDGAGVPVIYADNFIREVTHKRPEGIYEVLAAELPWGRHDGLPRDEVYFNDTPEPYTYGRAPHERTYDPEPEWHPLLLEIRQGLEFYFRGPFDVCFGNLYRSSRDYLGWHSDDSPEMDPDRDIVTVSFGAERPIDFRRRGLYNGNGYDARLMLESGSAAVMEAGMQLGWEHRIPKVGEVNIGPRLSLTFRGYIPKEP